MKTFSWIMLVLAILLFLFTGMAIAEYMWPSYSLSWIPLEISYWISWFWSWVRCIGYWLLVFAVVSFLFWLLFKYGRPTASFCRKHGSGVVNKGRQVAAAHPDGCKRLAISVGVFLLTIFLVGGLLVAYYW